MANLKNKILQALQKGKNVETILNDLSKSQENLLKNHSNPVFNNKDKNEIMKQYTNLQNIGKSLYHYNALNENNLASDSEMADIENTVLKGGISYNKYVWHSENGEHTCEVCKSLDGKVFDFYDEVPERPHPNCKCTIEIIENNNIEANSHEQEEPCDCYKFIERIDELVDKISTLREVINIRSSYIMEQLGYDLSLYLENWGHSILKQLSNSDNILGDLTSNFIESRENIFVNSDKFYHSKAFCEVAQRENEILNTIAIGAGQFRESLQFVESLIIEQKSWSEAVKEYQADMNANKTGFEIGKNYPNDDCGTILKEIWP